MSMHLNAPLRIEPVEGEFLTFMVESESAVVRPGEDWRDFAYRVDLEENLVFFNGKRVWNGSCVCQDFLIRSRKMMSQRKIYRCKHIKAARDFSLDAILTDYISRVRRRESLQDYDKAEQKEASYLDAGVSRAGS